MSVHLQREIERLKHMLLSLSALCEQQVHDATQAVSSCDADCAAEVVAKDPEIDQREVEIEEECLKVLALYQPVAIDLRVIVAVLKINNDLERVGDLTVNMAKRVIDLARHGLKACPFEFQEMAAKTKAMLKRSLDAFVNLDTDAARAILVSDNEVDAINRRVREEAVKALRTGGDQARVWIDVISISRALERIADLATNIAEDVIYLVEGEIVRHRNGAKAAQTTSTGV